MSKRKKKQLTLEDILEDLETLYLEAMRKGDLALSLKIKDLQATQLGLFEKLKQQKKRVPSLQDLTEAELAALLDELVMAAEHEN